MHQEDHNGSQAMDVFQHTARPGPPFQHFDPHMYPDSVLFQYMPQQTDNQASSQQHQSLEPTSFIPAFHSSLPPASVPPVEYSQYREEAPNGLGLRTHEEYSAPNSWSSRSYSEYPSYEPVTAQEKPLVHELPTIPEENAQYSLEYPAPFGQPHDGNHSSAEHSTGTALGSYEYYLPAHLPPAPATFPSHGEAGYGVAYHGYYLLAPSTATDSTLVPSPVDTVHALTYPSYYIPAPILPTDTTTASSAVEAEAASVYHGYYAAPHFGMADPTLAASPVEAEVSSVFHGYYPPVPSTFAASTTIPEPEEHVSPSVQCSYYSPEPSPPANPTHSPVERDSPSMCRAHYHQEPTAPVDSDHTLSPKPSLRALECPDRGAELLSDHTGTPAMTRSDHIQAIRVSLEAKMNMKKPLIFDFEAPGFLPPPPDIWCVIPGSDIIEPIPNPEYEEYMRQKRALFQLRAAREALTVRRNKAAAKRARKLAPKPSAKKTVTRPHGAFPFQGGVRSSSRPPSSGPSPPPSSAPVNATHFLPYTPPEEYMCDDEDATIVHNYNPEDGSTNVKPGEHTVVVFKGSKGKLRKRPHIACFHCKHRKIRCDDKVYDKNGRPYCEPCIERQAPCHWPKKYHPYLVADFFTARRQSQAQAKAEEAAEEPSPSTTTTTATNTSGFNTATLPTLDDEQAMRTMVAAFDPSNCPKRTSWTYWTDAITFRKQFDDRPVDEDEEIPKKRRRVPDEHWWDFFCPPRALVQAWYKVNRKQG